MASLPNKDELERSVNVGKGYSLVELARYLENMNLDSGLLRTEMVALLKKSLRVASSPKKPAAAVKKPAAKAAFKSSGNEEADTAEACGRKTPGKCILTGDYRRVTEDPVAQKRILEALLRSALEKYTMSRSVVKGFGDLGYNNFNDVMVIALNELGKEALVEFLVVNLADRIPDTVFLTTLIRNLRDRNYNTVLDLVSEADERWEKRQK